MSVTDSTMNKVLEKFADKYLNAAEQGGGTLIILTLIGLFVAWIGFSEYNRIRQESRSDEKEKQDREFQTKTKEAEIERADKLREIDKAEKSKFGDEIKAAIGTMSGKIDTLNDTFRSELHGLDKRLGLTELRTEDLGKRISDLENKAKI